MSFLFIPRGMREHETYTFTCTHAHKLQYCRVRTYVHTHMLLHKNALCVHAYIIHIYTRTSTNCCSRISFLLIPRVACVNMKHTHSHAHTHTQIAVLPCVCIYYTHIHTHKYACTWTRGLEWRTKQYIYLSKCNIPE